MSLEKKIMGILQSHWGLQSSELLPTTSFSNLGFDSLDLADLLIVLQDELHVRLDEHVMANVDTVEQLVAVIKSQSS